jgi:hypothetical protein
MALKIGTTAASLYLGSTPVAAYLGATQVYSAVQAVTLYFDGAVDGEWTTVGNWWLDAGHNEPAGRLPAEIDSVVATASITASGQTVVDFTLNDLNEAFFSFDGTLTVTGNGTFNSTSLNDGTIAGNAVFNDAAQNIGNIAGTAVFNGASKNDATVTGSATFNDTAQNFGTVTGTATFNDSACNAGGTAGTFVPAEPPECV